MKKISFTLLFFLGFIALVFAKDWDPQLIKATQLGYSGEIRLALSQIENYILNHPQDPNGLMVKANLLDWQSALASLGQDQQKRIILLLEKANNMALHRWDKNSEEVDALIDLGQSYLFLGRKYSEQGWWMKSVLTAKKCQKHLEKAFKKDASRVDALLSLGGFHYLAANTPGGAAPFKKILGIKGSREQGLKELRLSISQLHPYYYDAVYALFNIYLDYEKNPEVALGYLQMLEKEFFKNPEFMFQHARLLEKKSRIEAAAYYLKLADFCKKQKCVSDYTFLGYYHAGRMYKDEGKNKLAITYLREASRYSSQKYSQQYAESLSWPEALAKQLK